MVRRSWFTFAAAMAGVIATGCGGDEETKGGETKVPSLPSTLSATTTDTTFRVADQMLAAMELQVSGEPFAEILGRRIFGYDRFSATPNNYLNPDTGELEIDDTLGYGLAVETYEYSKQAMNNLAFEAGSGLSLQYGPLLNPNGEEGDAAFQLLFDRLQYFGLASRASGNVTPQNPTAVDFVAIAPDGKDGNHYGWKGFWPAFADFRSFDPKIAPIASVEMGCDLGGAIDEPVPPESLPPPSGDYECDYTTTNLPNRDAQVEKVLEPAAMGFGAWKRMLWIINYWQGMHDIGQNMIIKVREEDVPFVGIPGNSVIGQFESPLDPTDLVYGKDGTYLGGVSLEGFQGFVMLEEVTNLGVFLLKNMLTSDGTALGGFATTAEAINYNHNSPLKWWPAAVTVVESSAGSEPTKYFPKPTSFEVTSAESRLHDLSGVLGAFGNLYAVTDAKNKELGGFWSWLATFDGEPFPADNGSPDGEETPHDQALAVLKVALVNLDRLHWDAASAVLVDTSTVSGGVVKLGTRVDTFTSAYMINSLRTALRGLSSKVSLYGNDTPDTLGLTIPLDVTSLDGAAFINYEDHVIELIRAQADFISEKILDEGGTAANGYDLATGKRDTSPLTLMAQAAAVRGLLEAVLATSDTKYQQRAAEAFAKLDELFWMDDIGAFRTTLGEDSKMVYHPANFGVLQGALRQHYKLTANKPGSEDKAAKVLTQVERSIKLVLNGWDDTNGDRLIDTATECLGGRLQMAERALTGERSLPADGGDRDHDCVPDIATAGLPASLAAEIVIERK